MGGKKVVERVIGKRENIVRKGEGEVAPVGRGRRGEGEKIVRVGQVEVWVNGEGGGEKKVQKGVDVNQSPVLEVGVGRPKVAKREEVVVLNINEGGKITRRMEVVDEVTQPVVNHLLDSEGQPKDKGMLLYRSTPDDRDWARLGIVATIVTGC